jgi:hypothetical protein
LYLIRTTCTPEQITARAAVGAYVWACWSVRFSGRLSRVQGPAGVFEALGRLLVAERPELVPVLAAHLVQRLASELRDVEAVDADDRLGRVPVGARALGIAGSHVDRDRLDLPGSMSSQLVGELIGP